MKIYTRTGDDGSTGLIGGARVSKSDPRIDCTGEVDELNAALGWAAAVAEPHLKWMLQQIQSDLFIIGAHLAAPDPPPPGQPLPALDGEMTQRLEGQIDAAQQGLGPLGNFILPGGAEAAARLHLARAVCRRAERAVTHLAHGHSVAPPILAFLNRLSDWLFVHARLCNHQAGEAEVIWKPPRESREMTKFE